MVRILFSFQDCNEESCILSLDYEPDAFKRLVEKFVIDRNRMNSLRPPIILSDFYVWFVNNHLNGSFSVIHSDSWVDYSKEYLELTYNLMNGAFVE